MALPSGLLNTKRSKTKITFDALWAPRVLFSGLLLHSGVHNLNAREGYLRQLIVTHFHNQHAFEEAEIAALASAVIRNESMQVWAVDSVSTVHSYGKRESPATTRLSLVEDFLLTLERESPTFHYALSPTLEQAGEFAVRYPDFVLLIGLLQVSPEEAERRLDGR